MFRTEEIATANTAAATVGTTAASGKRVATTTVHFGPLTSSENVLALQNLAIPLNTSKNTSWATNAWIEWTEYVLQQGVDPEDAPSPLINQMTKEELNRWLPHFVMEARRQDGKPYPPNTLYQLCCGLLRHIRTTQPGWNIFTDVEFSDFQKTLDAQMKKLKSDGIGNTKRQAEPISLEDEEQLWTTGQLGMHTPQALLDTMFYLIGVSFGLRGGQEHRQLRWNPPQITVVAVSGERKHLLYVEDVSKNNCGGLKMRKVQPKHVIQHENLEKPDRCIVRVFEEYSRRCPPNRPDSSFYLKPLVKPKGDIWYAAVPVGHNTLDKTVARMCSAAGIIGFKTNHSLRVTLATRLFKEGVDEQLIMAKTGHRSTDGVRSYKRVSKEQMELISNVVQGSSLEKKPKLESTTEDTNKYMKPPMDKENVPTMLFRDCNITINFGK